MMMCNMLFIVKFRLNRLVMLVIFFFCKIIVNKRRFLRVLNIKMLDSYVICMIWLVEEFILLKIEGLFFFYICNVILKF